MKVKQASFRNGVGCRLELYGFLGLRYNDLLLSHGLSFRRLNQHTTIVSLLLFCCEIQVLFILVLTTNDSINRFNDVVYTEVKLPLSSVMKFFNFSIQDVTPQNGRNIRCLILTSIKSDSYREYGIINSYRASLREKIWDGNVSWQYGATCKPVNGVLHC